MAPAPPGLFSYLMPAKPAPGKPWIWRTEWFGHFPQADLALVARGWHVGYMNVKDMYGCPRSMALLDAYYQHVTKEYGLAPRAVLEDEGFDIFNLGADVIGLGGYLQGKMDAFAGEAVAAVGLQADVARFP